MQRYAIIVAGGKGLRMGNNEIPKQFLPLLGKPVIVHTIEKFFAFDPSIDFIVVIPEDQQDKWEDIRKNYLPDVSIRTVNGGAERFDSVNAGLALLDYAGVVAIHDAVRPFVHIQTIADSYEAAVEYGSGVAAVPLKDTLREITENGSTHRNRANYRLVQTPQTFLLEKIKNAFDQATRNDFTDDASVFEAAGYAVHLVDGTYDNIKITTREDLPK